MATPVLTMAPPAGSHRSRHRNAHKRSRMIYNLREHPEQFSADVREIVHDTREMAVNALGDYYDWDCPGCERAVLTHSLDDNCPNCGHDGRSH